MDKNAMYKDIQSLSYLGLDVKNDYIENTITLHLSNPGRKYVFTPRRWKTRSFLPVSSKCCH